MLQPYRLSGGGGEIEYHRKRSSVDGLGKPPLHGAPDLVRLNGAPYASVPGHRPEVGDMAIMGFFSQTRQKMHCIDAEPVGARKFFD